MLLLLFLVQQLPQELRILVPNVRRCGGKGNGASSVAVIVGAVMMMGQ